MDVAVVSAAYYEDASAISPMVNSAKRYGIDVIPYGIGMKWRGFFGAKVVDLLELLHKRIMSEYVLYVDSGDLVFRSGLRAICSSYKRISARGDNELVVSADARLEPHHECCEYFLSLRHGGSLWKYPCVGVFMGPRELVIKALSAVQELRNEMASYVDKKLANDDQGWWILAMQKGLVEASLDYRGELAVSLCSWKNWWFRSFGGDVVLHNGATPCIVHCNGLKAKNKLLPLLVTEGNDASSFGPSTAG